MSEMIVKLNTDKVKLNGCEYVQDLVRCGECRWYNCNACFRDGGTENGRRPDDFCSYGELK